MEGIPSIYYCYDINTDLSYIIIYTQLVRAFFFIHFKPFV